MSSKLRLDILTLPSSGNYIEFQSGVSPGMRETFVPLRTQVGQSTIITNNQTAVENKTQTLYALLSSLTADYNSTSSFAIIVNTNVTPGDPYYLTIESDIDDYFTSAKWIDIGSNFTATFTNVPTVQPITVDSFVFVEANPGVPCTQVNAIVTASEQPDSYGFSPTGTFFPVTTNPFTVPTLNRASSYFLYVRKDTDYTPIEGQNFRVIASKTAQPYFGLFDETLTEVSTSYTFADLPNASNTKIGAVSDNFTYMLAGGASDPNTPVRMSTDNGQSWTQLSYNATTNDITMSKSGKVMVIETGSSGYIAVSNNFGTTFTSIDLNQLISQGTLLSIVKVDLSSSGDTILVVGRATDISGNKHRILKSTDFGVSFSDITTSVGFPSTSGFYVSIDDALISGNGKYQIYFNTSNESRYSDDYGQTFVNKNYPTEDWNENGQISHNGEYFMLNSTNSPGRYSDDFGVTASLSTIANASIWSLGVSNSGKFSINGSSTSISDMQYSDDFFASFTTVTAQSGVSRPYIIIDVS